MYVMKRNGKRESVHFDKITSRISKLCYGLDAKVSLPDYPPAKFATPLKILLTDFISIPQHVDPVVISQKVIQGVYPGVTTSELDE
jgi:hypothetical protein